MAKTRSNAVPKKQLKECRVILKRLNQNDIDRYHDPSNITHNVSAKISKDIMKIDKTVIKATNNTFNIHIKLNNESIIIKQTPMIVNKPVSSRILRPRATYVPISRSKKLKNDQKSDLVVAQRHSKPTYKAVEDVWQQCKDDNIKNGYTIRLNDTVLAKLKGHAPWPATVIEFVSDTRVLVKFYGANDSNKFGYVSNKEITPFLHSMNAIRIILLTLKRDILLYRKGIYEAEIDNGVPSHMSILNQL